MCNELLATEILKSKQNKQTVEINLCIQFSKEVGGWTQWASHNCRSCRMMVARRNGAHNAAHWASAQLQRLHYHSTAVL